jgi:Spy/CpxP family protein refolding chaperone
MKGFRLIEEGFRNTEHANTKIEALIYDQKNKHKQNEKLRETLREYVELEQLTTGVKSLERMFPVLQNK